MVVRADRRGGADEGGPRPLVARADGARPRPTAPPSRSTASTRCSSSTPAARPASPRASCTPRPATTCTPRRPTKWVFDLRTRTSSGARPTSAGSPGTATSSTARSPRGDHVDVRRRAELARSRTACGRSIEKYRVNILYTAPTAIRAFMQVGRRVARTSTTSPACACWARWARRSTPRPGCGTTA